MDPTTTAAAPLIETPVVKLPTPTPVTLLQAAPAAKEKDNGTTTRLKAKTELTALQIKQKEANVVVHPRLKPTMFVVESNDAEPAKTQPLTVAGMEFYQFDELPLNRRGYKYKPCRANGYMDANLYLTCDWAPFGVRASYFDRLPGVACSQDMSAVTTSDGWLSVRSNVGIREGKYYFEYNIINANNGGDKSHVRIGIARKEAAIDAPVGFDGYGYGLRDLNGQKITLSRPKNFMEGFGSGDTIGFLVDLPSLSEQRSHMQLKEAQNQIRKKRRTNRSADDEERKLNLHNNVVRDQVPIKYKNALYYEQFEYTPTKQMDHLLNPVTVFGEKAVLEKSSSKPSVPEIPKSRVVVFKNGQCAGTMFEDLYSFLPLSMDDDTDANTKQLQNVAYRNTDDGSLGYYPMMSVFQNGVVGLNAGPDFKYPIPEDALPLSDRYTDRVVEEWMWDLVDEVEGAYLDEFE